MEAIILAGGLGTRLREVVSDDPKPMAPINNRPFLEYLLDYWIAQGVTRFILSTGYKGERIESHFGSNYKNVQIDFAREEKPLGTGGGLMLAMSHVVGETFLTLNGDTYFEVPLEKLANAHKKNRADISVSLLRVSDTTRYGCIHIGSKGRIKDFYRNNNNDSEGYINGGVYMIGKSVMQGVNIDVGSLLSLEEDIIPDLLLKNKKFYGYVVGKGVFIDIGIPEDYRRATQTLGALKRTQNKDS